MKQPIHSAEELKAIILAEIKLSEIGKIKSGETSVILARNSRSAVKRAKKEYKDGLKLKSNSVEHDAMIHQLVNSNPKMNLTVQLD